MTTTVEEIIRFVEDECDQSLDKLEQHVSSEEDIATFHIGKIKLACQILHFIKNSNKKEQSHEQ